MIKVIISTLSATREPTPNSIRRLSPETLRNLQTALNPVPPYLLDMEWWPETYIPVVYDPALKYKSGETLTAISATKTVNVQDILTDYTTEQLLEQAQAYEAAAIVLFSDAVQVYLDEAPSTRNYDGILSLCTYATSPTVTFANEATAGINWRDACWAYVYTVLANVKAGNRTEPTVPELLAELPTLVWPT